MKTFNKILPIAAASLLLAGCNGAKTETYYYGFGSTATYAVTAATETAAGTVQTDVDVASVLFNSKGEIVDVNVDVMQIKAASTAEAVTTLASKAYNDEANSDVKSKWELGTAYGMSGASAIGKEWYEQADAFENWAVGKKVADLSANLTDYHGGKALADGATVGTTITVDGFIETITEAWNAKAEFKASKANLGVAMYNSHAALQDDVTIGGAVFDEEGKVLASKVDVYQIPYVVTANGSFFDVTVNEAKTQVVAESTSIKSKVELGADYGMSGSSAIGKEWFEQASALEAWAVGKEVADLSANLVDYHGGKALGDGATVGITITVDSFLKVYEEAYTVSQSATR